VARVATRKKSLVRHENYFRREGRLVVQHCRTADEVLPQLAAFFAQHTARWAAADSPSLFEQPDWRSFYERWTQVADGRGWLRFTRVEWDGRPIAFHYGICYRGSYIWYKPTFAIELARRSPGMVLLRQVLLAALEEGAHTFDFGIGDEAYKHRFATHVNRVRTWGLYPPCMK
jgi:CelD/BcsL family acetyltransferase involved in cellulose biosynthesis